MHKYFFFDRGILQPQGISNFKITTCKGEKDTQYAPFFKEDYFSDAARKWEVRYDNSYPNIIYDKKSQIYRLYYTLIIKDEESEETGLEMRAHKNYIPMSGRVVAMAYAESIDGVNWEKPDLGLVEFDGNKKNNLMMNYVHGTSVFLDDDEIDEKKRYKLLTRVDYPGGKRCMAVAFSEDGIDWSPLIPWPKYKPEADSHNFAFRDPQDGKYKVVTRIWKNGLRIAAMSESTDFINWSEPKEILRGDGFERQVYSMPVFYYEGLFIGLASMFHEGDRTLKEFDLVDCELTYATRMGIFDYVAPGEPCIERGYGKYPNGEFDCGCIYAASPILVDDRLCIYYMGGNGQHTNFRETSFARAFFEKDKLACLTARDDKEESIVSTMPFCFYGEKLEVLIDKKEESEFSLAIFDKWNGEALQGYDFSDCLLEPGDDGYTKISFKKKLADINAQKACMVIRAKYTDVYAVRGEIIENSSRY